MLFKATNGFSASNLLGVGYPGAVFRGVLDPKNMVVVVKLLKLQHQGASRSFSAEGEVFRSFQRSSCRSSGTYVTKILSES